MCAACDVWVAERHDPNWKPRKGGVGRVPKLYGITPQAVGWSGKTRREALRLIRQGINPGSA